MNKIIGAVLLALGITFLGGCATGQQPEAEHEHFTAVEIR